MRTFVQWLRENAYGDSYPQGSLAPYEDENDEEGMKKPWAPPRLRGNPANAASVDPHLLRNIPQPEQEMDPDMQYDPVANEPMSVAAPGEDDFNPYSTPDDPESQNTYGGIGEEEYYRNQMKYDLEYAKEVAIEQLPQIAQDLAAKNALSRDVVEAKKQMYKEAKKRGLNPKAVKMILKAGPMALRLMSKAGVTPSVRYS
jgi:uncharacterized protein (UPF0335 family)